MALLRFYVPSLWVLFVLVFSASGYATDRPILVISSDFELAERFANEVGPGAVAYTPPTALVVSHLFTDVELLELAESAENWWSSGNFSEVLKTPWNEVVRSAAWTPMNSQTWVPVRSAVFIALGAAIIEGDETALSSWANTLVERYPHRILCEDRSFPEACAYLEELSKQRTRLKTLDEAVLAEVPTWTSLSTIQLRAVSGGIHGTLFTSQGVIRSAFVNSEFEPPAAYRVLLAQLTEPSNSARLPASAIRNRRLMFSAWATGALLSATTVGLTSTRAQASFRHRQCLNAPGWACFETERYPELRRNAVRSNRAVWASAGLSALSIGVATTLTLKGWRADDRSPESLSSPLGREEVANSSTAERLSDLPLRQSLHHGSKE